MSRNYGTQCPECGSARNVVQQGSLDEQGHRIRRRVCLICEANYTTVEIALPFSFGSADALYRERHGLEGPQRRGNDQFIVSESGKGWHIKLEKGEASNRCRRGLHELEGENVYVSPKGQRVCNACRRAKAKERYANKIAKMPASLRDELREQRRLESASRVEYRTEWARRKRAAA